MPLYEYKCTKCGAEVEVLQKHDDEAPCCDRCEEKESMKKQMSLSSFRLKGVGWYETDYKNKKETVKK
jgi:putative FmdB family regulatory protein